MAISPQINPAHAHPFDIGWRERTLVFFTLGLVLTSFVLLGNHYATSQLVEILGLVPVTFLAVGKFLPLWSISGKSSLGPYQLGAVIWALDTVTVVVFVYSFEMFYRIRPFRRALDRLYTKMTTVLKAYPLFKKASTWAVMLFVLFPVSGTGALGATLIGIILGMHRFALIVVVSAGGALGGLIMAFLAANFASTLTSFESIQNNPAIKHWIYAGLLILIVVGIYFLNRAFSRALAQAEISSPNSD